MGKASTTEVFGRHSGPHFVDRAQMARRKCRRGRPWTWRPSPSCPSSSSFPSAALSPNPHSESHVFVRSGFDPRAVDDVVGLLKVGGCPKHRPSKQLPNVCRRTGNKWRPCRCASRTRGNTSLLSVEDGVELVPLLT